MREYESIAASIAILCVGGWCRKTVAVACVQMSDRSDGHCRQLLQHCVQAADITRRVARRSSTSTDTAGFARFPYSPILSHTAQKGCN
ncbi:MAG: hypothetical protein IKA65_03110 [Lentisphaeria bacterium]|nr:hypothetical protein [Lentisphaeria bacterium]